MQTLILTLGAMAGAIFTFILQQYGITAVVASCMVGLSGAFIGYLISDNILPMAIFAGSFVGMTAIHLTTIPVIILAGGMAGLIFSSSSQIFTGFGGKLGTIAFISCITCIFIMNFFTKK